MKLHTDLGILQLDRMLDGLETAGIIARGVDLIILGSANSRSHTRRIDFSLGLEKADATHRRARNLMGSDDGGYRYAATYDDWGWLMASIFAADPSAKFQGAYNGVADFKTRTWQAFTAVEGADPFPYAPDKEHPQHRRYTEDDSIRYAWLGLHLDDRSTAVAA